MDRIVVSWVGLLGQGEDVLVVFFFFQAEDGIRDHCVTGVQTCALPISFRGSGIAKILAYRAFDHVVDSGAKMKLTCTYLEQIGRASCRERV